MAYNKKKLQEISDILNSVKGSYIGQSLTQESLELVENLTIGDVILEFGFNVDEASQVLGNVVMMKRKNAAVGFTANVVKESKSRKLRESYAGYGYDSSTNKAFNDLDMALNTLVVAGVVKEDIIEIVETTFGDYNAGSDYEDEALSQSSKFTPDNY